MKIKIITTVIGVIFATGFFAYAKISGIFESELSAPQGPAYVKPVPDDWPAYRQAQNKAKAAHLENHAEAYDRFAKHSVSQTDGIPLIILKVLPQLAPEFWGEKDNFLSAVGLFYDERYTGFPFPSGIGFSGLARKERMGNIDYASFTCGGCHIGRVRLEDNRYLYLDGGINSEFDVIGYRWRIVQTLNKVYSGETNRDKKNQLILQAILTSLEKAQARDPHFFYNNYHTESRTFDAQYEAEQIALFKQNATKHVNTFIEHQEQVYANWRLVAKENYSEIEERISKGFPGMEDAIGFNAIAASQGLKGSALTKPFASLPAPKVGAITDIMVIWEQDKRNPRWNEAQTNLINGGGQWNGHIPLPIYKNIAAQITLGFDDVDISVSAFSNDLIDQLPATVYPFDVDVELARKGQTLFAENCADCHQPNNGRVYTNIGTDMGRALVAGTVITLGAQLGFTSDSNCSPETTIEMYGKQVQPCATYRGVSLKDKKKFAMTAPRVHAGYNALPLSGLWAQAPYLHAGSVPTLYHLLIPSERPNEFIKSRLDYDQEKVGFSWDPNVLGTSTRKEGYLFKPASSSSIGNQGHDQDITMDGKTFKLNWEDDREGATALLEYLKTL